MRAERLLSHGQTLNATFDLGYDRIRRRGARGDAHCLCTCKPVRLDIRRRLHVMDARTVAAASPDQLVGVVAVRAADNDNNIRLLREFNRCVLTLFGRLADGVN